MQMNSSTAQQRGLALAKVFVLALVAVAHTGTEPLFARTSRSQIAKQAAPSEAGRAIIRSRMALATYLRQTLPGDSPIDRLSAGGRARFLASLRFGKTGLVGFRFTDLRAELSADEIFAILSLFGAQQDVSVIEGVTPVSAPDVGPGAAGASPALRRRYAVFSRLPTSMDLSRQSVIRAFGMEYRAAFSTEQTPANVAKIPHADLDVLYQAADLASFYSQDPIFVHDMQVDLDELVTRHEATETQFEEMYSTLINDRDFSRARELERVHPAPLMRPLPMFVDATTAGGPTDLVLSSDGRTLTRRSVSLDRGARIIIVATPLCHFCQQAIQGIESDPNLRGVFRAHATWIVPPDDEGGGFGPVSDWNRAHPHEQMTLAYKVQEWPMLDRWGQTPTFYFFKGGRLLAQIVGWSGPASETGLRSALRRIGPF